MWDYIYNSVIFISILNLHLRNQIEIFDSLGIDLTKLNTLKLFCKFCGVKNMQYNETSFQDQNSNSCGFFVIYYIWQRMYNLDLSFDEILELSFEKEIHLNENIVKMFCESLEKENKLL